MSYYRWSYACEDCMGTGGMRDHDGNGSCGACGGTGRLRYGSFEVFEVTAESVQHAHPPEGEEPMAVGWYWWACSPGCLPEGDPEGPFATEQEAIDNAQEDD